jgi:hypothetical protein
MPVQERRRFANLPQTSGSVRIADVLVTSPADYNRNGAVDAADYVLWQDRLGQMGAGLAADGNNNGQVDAGDYDVWRANFGKSAGGAGAVAELTGGTVPEPATTILLFMASVTVHMLTFHQRVRCSRADLRYP